MTTQTLVYRDDVTRYFLDTEFMEDGKTIDLISIGLVCEDGREYYAINQEAKLHKANPWVRQNVLPQLPKHGDPMWKSKATIAAEVLLFLTPLHKYQPELWAYYADYDWVVFCQLYGRMIDLPSKLPMYCMDLKQHSVMLGSPTHPTQPADKAHDALEDARWNASLFKFLKAP